MTRAHPGGGDMSRCVESRGFAAEKYSMNKLFKICHKQCGDATATQNRISHGVYRISMRSAGRSNSKSTAQQWS